jgi:amino acid transporter
VKVDAPDRRPGTPPQASNDWGRQETEEERDDRNLMELLQELRVAGIGIQVLFGFLLALPFAARFTRLDATQRHLYVATLAIAAVSIGLLSAPVAFHRLVFRQHKKDRVLRIANAMALAGLASVAIAVSLAVLLVTGVVLVGLAIPLIFSLIVLMFLVLWLVVPLAYGRHAGGDDD